MKKAIKWCMICISLIALLIGLRYCLNNGVLIRKDLDLTYINSENPSRRRLSINPCNTATVTVTGFSEHIHGELSAKIEGYPDIMVVVYLKEKQLAQVDIGDTIVVQGNIKYYTMNSLYYNHYIVIGDAISVFPFTFDAGLVEILSKEKQHGSQIYTSFI